MPEWLQLERDGWSSARVAGAIAVAWAFAVAVRLYWPLTVGSAPDARWLGIPMLNTHDGYWFARGARDLLEAAPALTRASAEPLARLAAALSRVLSVPLDAVTLWLPVFAGSLVVVPMVLLGHALGMARVGFVAALLCSSSAAYYDRTMAGSFDTDMLNLVLPTTVAVCVVVACAREARGWLALVTLAVAACVFWYPQSAPLMLAIAGAAVAGAFATGRTVAESLLVGAFTLAGLLPFAPWGSVAAVIVLGVLLQRARSSAPLAAAAVVVLFAVFVSTGGVDFLLWNVERYLLRPGGVTQSGGAALHFFSVTDTIREARPIPLAALASRLSGHLALFVAACAGCALLVRAHPSLLSVLPLAALGLLAPFAGRRFAFYAAPVFALGLGYLLFLAGRLGGRWKPALVCLMTALALAPALAHVRRHQVPTVLTAQEVGVLDRLRATATNDAWVASWWDYGYAIQYYARVRTWTDGARHGGELNFPVSFLASTTSQVAAARMARLYTEYTSRRLSGQEPKRAATVFEEMLLGEGFRDPAAFLAALEQPGYPLPSSAQDVYLVLPLRLLPIFPVVRQFSNLDLASGEAGPPARFHLFPPDFPPDAARALRLDSERGVFAVGERRLPLKAAYSIRDAEGRTRVDSRRWRDAGASLLLNEDRRLTLLADEPFVRSVFARLALFEDYDPQLFELVVRDPLMMVFRVRM